MPCSWDIDDRRGGNVSPALSDSGDDHARDRTLREEAVFGVELVGLGSYR
jgi:hypothetical protein